MPDSSNNVNARDGASIVWGPEICVSGKRPEWLAPGTPGMFENRPGQWLDMTNDVTAWSWSETANDGKGCPVHIRLPADHPHYRQPITLERDPALWDRMEALVRRMAKGFYLHAVNEEGIGTTDAVVQAQGIVRDLPTPVDPDEEAARDVAARVAEDASSFDLHDLEMAALEGIKRGRELAQGERA